MREKIDVTNTVMFKCSFVTIMCGQYSMLGMLEVTTKLLPLSSEDTATEGMNSNSA